MRVGLADERSDDEEEEEEEMEGGQTGKKMLEGEKEAEHQAGTQPIVLVNGKPVEGKGSETAEANGGAEVMRRGTRESRKYR